MRLNILKKQFTALLLSFFLLGESLLFCESLSLEEKIGQLLIVCFEGLDANEEAEHLIKKAHVGGFIYYDWANGLQDPEQVKNLSANLQKLATTPLWICIDQEGGPVSRLGKNFPRFLGSRELSQMGDLKLVKMHAANLGKQLLDVGINMNLAPVVDISVHPEKSFMARRTYGDDPRVVTIFAEQTLLGLKEAGILAVLKHFPGCGDVEVDPHNSLPILYKSKKELEEVEFFPFKNLQAPGIMTSHILVPALDPIHCATLSYAITTAILRNECCFEGLILSDSLVMQGLLDQCPSIEEAAIQTFLAGADLLLLGGRDLKKQCQENEINSDIILRIHGALVEAVKTNRIPLVCLEESVARNLTHKKIFITK